jgi:hypothetical protein
MSSHFEYYSYVLIYVDDILLISLEALADQERLITSLRSRKDSVGDPDIYLGSKFRKVMLSDGVHAWMISPTKYIREAINNVERHSEREYGSKLPKRVSGPFPTDYRPEVDITPELNEEELSYYQSQIGVLRWMVELGRIDIVTEVSCLALPRKAHLEAVFHIYAYLKKKTNGTIIMDPTYPDIDLTKFNDGAEWSSFYGDIQDVIPFPSHKGRH